MKFWRALKFFCRELRDLFKPVPNAGKYIPLGLRPPTPPAPPPEALDPGLQFEQLAIGFQRMGVSMEEGARAFRLFQGAVERSPDSLAGLPRLDDVELAYDDYGQPLRIGPTILPGTDPRLAEPGETVPAEFVELWNVRDAEAAEEVAKQRALFQAICSPELMMNEPDIEVNNDGLLLRGTYGRKNKGRGVFIARIDGTDPKWTYKRKFLGHSKTVTVQHGAESWEEQHVEVRWGDLMEGDLLEISGGRFMGRRAFYRILRPVLCSVPGCEVDHGPKLEQLDDDRFRQLLGEKLARERPAPTPSRKFRFDERGEHDSDNHR